MSVKTVWSYVGIQLVPYPQSQYTTTCSDLLYLFDQTNIYVVGTTDFHRFTAIGTSSECWNESRIHYTVDQCYEIWVHSDITSSFRLLRNNENLSFTSPSVGDPGAKNF